MMGLSLGVIMCLSVLFQLTKNLDPMVSWGIMSIIQILFSISLLYIVKEPDIVSQADHQQPKLKQMWSLTKQTFRAMKDNRDLLISYILFPLVSGPMIVVEIYIMSWLISTYD